MGNNASTSNKTNASTANSRRELAVVTSATEKSKYKGAFPGSAILEKTFCGSIDTTDPSEYEDVSLTNRLLKRADILCISSPVSTPDSDYQGDDSFVERSEVGAVGTTPTTSTPVNPSSAMLARALVSEVTDNPKTMKPAEMAAREKKLLKAQKAALQNTNNNQDLSNNRSRPIGAPGGVGPPAVLHSLVYAVTGDDTAPPNLCIAPNNMNNNNSSSTNGHVDNNGINGGSMPPGPLQENRAAGATSADTNNALHLANGNSKIAANNTNGGYNPNNPHCITIGLSMSRRSAHGNPNTVTRQTAFDFNELQDRSYKYVSSTDATGWRAGGGERGGGSGSNSKQDPVSDDSDEQIPPKQAATDTVHIPIIHLDCPDAGTVDEVVAALAAGEIFIPHMQILPEALSVAVGKDSSPPDLVVRFGCERNDDLPADEWPNWCLEFMHNQLYEYFYAAGAKWNKRPFSITLAHAVRWKTVKHMNRYFAHAERVIESWREDGPQYLDPQLSYIEGGATPEEVAKPHGIYLLRKGVPTNYFAPNFEPPYTTKMTRSLLGNVLGKSWDKKRREWTAAPIPKLVTPTMLMAAACGCADPSQGGFMANQVTTSNPMVTSPLHMQQVARTATTEMEVTRNEVVLADERNDPDGDEPLSSSPSAAKQDLGEEKKSDDPRQLQKGAHGSGAPKSNTNSKQQQDRSFATDAASEFGQQSVAMSGTTVMHTNLTSNRLYSDEDWSPGPKESPSSAAAKKLQDAQDVLDREKAKALASPAGSGRKGIEAADSGVSLEYSTDGSSAFFNQAGSPFNRASEDASSKKLEDDASNLSIQDSATATSEMSVVPSDEELFSVGWAKALDPSSGNYYYFTLDRSKTVWENPLLHK